jgi:hypothetical protein
MSKVERREYDALTVARQQLHPLFHVYAQSIEVDVAAERA